MQLPFYSEFRLPWYTRICIYVLPCMCVCVIAIHVPYIRLYRLVSLRREFVTDSRVFDVLLQALFSLPFSPDCYSILLSSPSLYHLILSRSLLRYCYPGMHRKSPVHVYPHCTSYVYLLDRFTLGALFWHIHEREETRTHGYGAAVPPANYFCLASLSRR